MTSLPIALVGMRGSGKTTIGGLLAAALGRPFRDLDDEVVRFGGFSGHASSGVGALVEEVGWARFRELEAATLKKLIEPMPRIVLATGGGVVERADNRAWLQRATRAFYLEVPVELLQLRLEADATHRPALGPGGDPVAELPRIARTRDPLYRAVAEPVDCRDLDPAAIAARIRARLEP